MRKVLALSVGAVVGCSLAGCATHKMRQRVAAPYGDEILVTTNTTSIAQGFMPEIENTTEFHLCTHGPKLDSYECHAVNLSLPEPADE